MRLIDADALQEQIPETREDIFENCRRCTLLDANEVLGIIDEAPTIEAEPTYEQVKEYCRKRCLVVVDSGLFNEMKARWSETVKHGRWIYKEYGYPTAIAFYKCSVCGKARGFDIDNYCPNCGAKMDDEPTQKSVGKALKALEATDETD